jgi:hypothetical protein
MAKHPVIWGICKKTKWDLQNIQLSAWAFFWPSEGVSDEIYGARP